MSQDQAEDDKSKPQAWQYGISNNSAISSVAWTGSIGQQAHFGAHQPRLADYRAQYAEDAKIGTAAARRRYHTLIRTFWTLRYAVIGASLLVAVLAAAAAPAWIVATFGALSAALQTIIIASHLQEKAVAHGLLSEGMARQLRDFELRLGAYASAEDPITVLHEKIEALREAAASERFRLDRATSPSDEAPKA